MYAVIRYAGHQWLVGEKQEITVDHVDAKEGDKVTLDDVLVVFGEDGSPIHVGTPKVSGATIAAKVLRHQQGDKMHVIKFQNKKRYRRRIGFRAQQTVLLIEKITV